MTTTTEAVLDKMLLNLSKASSSQDVFGPLTGSKDEMLAQARKFFRHMAKLSQPDVVAPPLKAKAGEVFRLLHPWWDKAQLEIERGEYGKKGMAAVTVTSKKAAYVLSAKPTSGDLADVFQLIIDGKPAILKVAKNPSANEMLLNEQRTLAKLREKPRREVIPLLDGHTPRCLDSFLIDKKQANVLTSWPGLYTLDEVNIVHTDGVSPKDMAWMFRRVLGALGAAHTCGIVHGAVLPTHFMVAPADHNGFLVDWCYAVDMHTPLKSISPKWRNFYPPEVFAKKPASSATDLYMAAKCMIYVFGGTGDCSVIPASVPAEISNFLRILLIDNPARRPQYALDLHSEFGDICQSLWGKPKFNKFTMPIKA